MPWACLSATRRVLWLEDELASSPSDDLVALDGAMRVLEAAYESLEEIALLAPRAHPLRLAALRLVGARRTWLAIVADARAGVEDLEREATWELEQARLGLRRAQDDISEPHVDPRGVPNNVVSLAARRARG